LVFFQSAVLKIRYCP